MRAALADPSGRALRGIAWTVGGLAVFVVVRAALPEWAALPASVLMAGVVWAIARWAAVSREDAGLGRDRLGSGLRWGLAGAGIVLAVLIVGALLPATDHLFADRRTDVSLAEMLVRVLVVIPLGTILLEELAFRGSLLTLFRRRLPTVVAVLAASILFGLWHVVPAIQTANESELARQASEQAGGGLLAPVLATVATTTFAGLVACVLRLVSGSLVAPALVHLATNGGAFAIAWFLATG